MYQLFNRVFHKKRKKQGNSAIKTRKRAIYVLITLFILFAELSLFFLYGFFITINTVNEDSKLGIQLTTVYLILSAILPFLPFLLKLNKKSIQKNVYSLSSTIILFIVIFSTGIYLSLDKENVQSNVVEQTPQVLSELSGNDLLKAVNIKRQKNNLLELKNDPSTCAIAKLRAQDFAAFGIDAYYSKASLQRAVDKAFKENSLLNDTTVQMRYYNFITYQSNTPETIKFWENGAEKIIFARSDFIYGCVEVREGYGALIVGQTSLESQNRSSDKPFVNTKKPVSYL